MRLTNATKEELMAIPMRQFDEFLDNVWCAYVIPTDKIHDSGFAVMNFVCEFHDEDKPPIRCGGYCDDIELDGKGFRIDCTLPDNIIRIHNNRLFSVSDDLSSITFSDGTGTFEKWHW